ncbi:glycosyltransferase family 4 protein [Alsobacter sp. KACC 23698]|uniref:Glycosyltransferase family 4 protein n=1 Tax=Alsobacter sp. KACC 23698 TaxID=3149229 RepID=A0AAU7JB22_9HYPH
MKIAQVAPLAEAVPPKLYGGTERVVSWLTEALVADGHDVTLFASGDSLTSAKLCAMAPEGLRLAGIRDHLASHLVMVDHVRKRAAEFDVIHFHVDLIQFPLCQDIAHKTLTTMHGRLDLPDFHPIYRAFPDMPLVSISDNQRLPMPAGCNWRRTIYHGLPATHCPYNAKGGDYLAFLGRISPEKRPDRAIEIAIKAGVPLKIAAKVDKADQDYFDKVVAPLLDHPLVEFIGEINDREKCAFLGDAMALLFPIDWCEPFGLVMIEAMSSGTPVIAWPLGSVPEVVDDGVTGCIVSSVDEAVKAVERARSMSRAAVRARFEERFTATHMARAYVETYAALRSDTGEARAPVPLFGRDGRPTLRPATVNAPRPALAMPQSILRAN